MAYFAGVNPGKTRYMAGIPTESDTAGSFQATHVSHCPTNSIKGGRPAIARGRYRSNL